jgi:hypothetical protein
MGAPKRSPAGPLSTELPGGKVELCTWLCALVSNKVLRFQSEIILSF